MTADQVARPNGTRADAETGRYLGCPLRITNREVVVYAPVTGREIGIAYSMSGARRLVRGYRGSKR